MPSDTPDWTRHLRQLGGVAGVYGLSVGALAVGEAVSGQLLPAAVFGQYSLARSTLPLLALIGTLAIEQVIPREIVGPTREGTAWSPIIRRTSVRTLGLSIAGALASLWWLGLAAPAAICVALTPVLIAYTNILAGISRSIQSYIRAAWQQQGYRLFTGSFLLISGLLYVILGQQLDGILHFAVPLLPLIGALAMLVQAGSLSDFRPSGPDSNPSLDWKGTRSISWAFALSSISLGGMDWADQAAVSAVSDPQALGLYASAKAILVYPLIAGASILGFTAVPELVRYRAAVTRSRFVLLTSAVLVVGALGSSLVIVVTDVLPLDRLHNLPLSSRSALGAAAVSRFASVLPSAVLGAFAGPRLLLSFSVAGCALVVAELGIGLLAVPSLGLEGVILAVLFAGMARLAIGILLALRAIPPARPTVGEM